MGFDPVPAAMAALKAAIAAFLLAGVRIEASSGMSDSRWLVRVLMVVTAGFARFPTLA